MGLGVSYSFQSLVGEAKPPASRVSQRAEIGLFFSFPGVLTNRLSLHTRLSVTGDRRFSPDGVQAGGPGGRVKGST